MTEDHDEQITSQLQPLEQSPPAHLPGARTSSFRRRPQSSKVRWAFAVGASVAVTVGLIVISTRHDPKIRAAATTLGTTSASSGATATSTAPPVTTVEPPQSLHPKCSTFFRPTSTQPSDTGPVLDFAQAGTQSASFDDLRLEATYSADRYNGPSLNLRVLTLPSSSQTFAALYQFDPSKRVADPFAATGQGFSGLIYANNPTSGSEMQFFCSIDEP
jgi:hypothetical protein